jgi:4-cresol dehydrogenase (hydroxylating)
VAPESAGEVREIVRLANQYRIPLYVISTGRNLTYGGSAPVYSGSVVLDLKRMNRIVEVDERNAYCIVEPGVSFFDLFRHLRENRIQLRMSIPDPGWGSPIGNALEHGVGRSIQRDHFRSHCGMEVVLGNGELVRTGTGALPTAGSLWGTFPYGYGPYIDGMFSQSNFGIVTKMGFQLIPEPEVTRIFDIGISRFDDLDPLLEEVAFLHTSGVLNCNSELVIPLLSVNIPDSRALLERPGGASAQDWDALGDRLGVPTYTLEGVNIMGPEKVVQAQYDYVIERLSRFRGFKVRRDAVYRRGVDPEAVPNRDKCAMGIPSLQVFSFGAMVHSTGHMDFSPVFPMTGEAVRTVNGLMQQAFKEAGVPWGGWRGGNTWIGRALIMIQPINLTPDPAENQKRINAFRILMTSLAAAGYPEYRTHAMYHDLLMEQFSFNNHALLRLHEAIKDAVDPQGILSAGRSGIWPKHLRKDNLRKDRT